MMIGVAFSRGDVSMRIRPSIGSALPRWRVMSTSAGNVMVGCLLLVGRVVCSRREKRRKGRYLVGRAFDGHHRRAVGVQCGGQRTGQTVDLVDVDGGQPGEHRGQPGAEPARAESVVAVAVAVEELFTG